jgi:hypothetical protein
VSGESDLASMLETLSVSRRPGTFVVSSSQNQVGVGDGVHATIVENEGVSVVADLGAANENGWAYDFECAWLTVDVHSSLDAVGLTAAVAERLASRGIACNVLAGFYHDHLLVAVDRADEAIASLTSAP